MRDLLVVGGGPAGLASALYASRAGLDVTVWEARSGAIDKACGEGLMPSAVTALTELGADPPGEALAGIAYCTQRRRAAATFRGGSGRGVRRTALHEALRNAVRDAGVPIEQRSMRRLRTDGRSARADGVPVGHVIAADGLHSPTRRLLDLNQRSHLPRRYGLRAHARTAPWTDYVEVHWAQHGEAYVTPVGPDLTGVAILTSRRGRFHDHLRGFPTLRDRLSATAWGDVAGAGPLHQVATRRVLGRVLLVGDAAGYVDALTGEGISLAVAEARAAVDAIVAADLARYEDAWRRITRTYRLLTTGLVTASRVPAARRLLVPGACAFPRLFAGAVHALSAGPARPEPIAGNLAAGDSVQAP